MDFSDLVAFVEAYIVRRFQRHPFTITVSNLRRLRDYCGRYSPFYICRISDFSFSGNDLKIPSGVGRSLRERHGIAVGTFRSSGGLNGSRRRPGRWGSKVPQFQ